MHTFPKFFAILEIFRFSVGRRKETLIAHTAQAAGETKPLTMTLGLHCSHKSKYTVIKLGDHNIVPGRPFLRHTIAARV